MSRPKPQAASQPSEPFTTPHVREALKGAAGALAVAARGAPFAECQKLLQLAATLSPDTDFVAEASILQRGRAWDLVKGQLFVASQAQRKRLLELGEDPDGGLAPEALNGGDRSGGGWA